MANGDQRQGRQSKWDPAKDKVLLGRIVKGRPGKEKAERFRWQLRSYDGGPLRVVAWREFWGDRTGEWIEDIDSRNTLKMPMLGSVVKASGDLAAHLMGPSSAPNAPAKAAAEKHREASKPERSSAPGEDQEDDIPF